MSQFMSLYVRAYMSYIRRGQTFNDDHTFMYKKLPREFAKAFSLI
jgi:hypothetical protein